jgi:leucyl aminopeptidase
MTTRDMTDPIAALDASTRVFAAPEPASSAIPITLATSTEWTAASAGLDGTAARWLAVNGFKPAGRRIVTLPDAAGGIARVVIGAAKLADARPDPMAAAAFVLGSAAQALPAGRYRLDETAADGELSAVAWGLGGYRFRRYKTAAAEPIARLELPGKIDAKRVRAIVDGTGFGRDLINLGAGDLGPTELEAAARQLAGTHAANIDVIVGNDLLAKNFPLVHAVGRASTRAPRLIDLTWGGTGPKITLVGKGICFDTGGLDLKPASGMLLMKKDMGGAASVLALAHMIMAMRLSVQLRVIIPAAENAVAGNAFRPGDVIRARSGATVEIGNTDAEGRLVLCDALALADQDSPDLIVTFATLTGAARTALGPELPPLYCDDDAFTDKLVQTSHAVGDPLWRMPFWTGYETMFDSPVADMNNVSESPFAGSVVAALYLRRFVKRARRYAHLDIFGWRPAAKPLGPRGGEVQGARALFHLIGSGGL